MLAIIIRLSRNDSKRQLLLCCVVLFFIWGGGGGDVEMLAYSASASLPYKYSSRH